MSEEIEPLSALVDQMAQVNGSLVMLGTLLIVFGVIAAFE